MIEMVLWRGCCDEVESSFLNNVAAVWKKMRRKTTFIDNFHRKKDRYQPSVAYQRDQN